MEDILYLHHRFDSKKTSPFKNHQDSLPVVQIALGNKSRSLALKAHLQHTLKAQITCLNDGENDLDQDISRSQHRTRATIHCLVIEIRELMLARQLEFILDPQNSEANCSLILIGSTEHVEKRTMERLRPLIYRELERVLDYDQIKNLVLEILIGRFGWPAEKLLARPSDPLQGSPSDPNSPSSIMLLPESGLNLKETLASIEDSLILQALNRSKGNKNKASKLLQLNRTTLIEKLKKKGLDKDS